MAYFETTNIIGKPPVPVSVTVADWRKFLGQDGQSTTPPLPFPGQRLIATDLVWGEAMFILAFGVASLAIGDAVRIGGGYATTRTVAGTRGMIGISLSANTDTAALSWFCIMGQVPATVAAATAINTPLNMTATAGALDDAVVAGDGLSGAVAATAQGATVTTKVVSTVNGSDIVQVPDLGGLYVGALLTCTGLAGIAISNIGYGGLMLGYAGPQARTIQMASAATATGSSTGTFAHSSTRITAMLAHPFANGAL